MIRGVVAWYPVTDLMGIQADAEAIGGEPHNTPDARETALLGGLISDLPELAADASPVSHVAAATAPFFLAHGTADLGVPFAQSVRLRDALLAAGASDPACGGRRRPHVAGRQRRATSPAARRHFGVPAA